MCFSQSVVWKGVKVRAVDLAHLASVTFSGGDERFVDEEFTPGEEACVSKGVAVEWVRAVAVGGPTAEPKLFDGIEPTDVCQGAIGDCWLLAAIAACAEFPNFIEDRLFKTKAFAPDGKYVLSLYDCAARAFVDVVVDSFIPCHPRQWWEAGCRPLFAQPCGDELYILLLEKAFAKFAGGYQALSGGFPSLAWLALTGCEDQHIWKRRADGEPWVRHAVPVESRRAAPRSFAALALTVSDEKVPRSALALGGGLAPLSLSLFSLSLPRRSPRSWCEVRARCSACFCPAPPAPRGPGNTRSTLARSSANSSSLTPPTSCWRAPSRGKRWRSPGTTVSLSSTPTPSSRL